MLIVVLPCSYVHYTFSEDHANTSKHFFLLCIVTHAGYDTYTATLLTRLIDILTLFIILRIHCNLQCSTHITYNTIR